MTGTTGMPDSNHVEDEDGEPPAVVIYFVEPCTLGVDGSEVQRLACLGLLRCFSMMVNVLPEALRNNVSVQVTTHAPASLTGNLLSIDVAHHHLI